MDDALCLLQVKLYYRILPA